MSGFFLGKCLIERPSSHSSDGAVSEHDQNGAICAGPWRSRRASRRCDATLVQWARRVTGAPRLPYL